MRNRKANQAINYPSPLLKPPSPFFDDKEFQPTVGIFTCPSNHAHLPFAGNKDFFSEIIHFLRYQGIICYVFMAEGIHEKGIKGFYRSDNRWIKSNFPFPNVVYNRVPSRNYEKSKEFTEVVNFCMDMDIPFFNPRFVDKYEMNELLNDSPILTPYLPQTLLYKTEHDLLESLNEWRKIYVKPVFGKRGEGIFTLEEMNGNIVYQDYTQIRTYLSIGQFVTDSEYLTNQRYILQKAIEPKRLRGNRYDYRVLVNSKSQNGFKVSAVSVRMAMEQQITTHNHLGGKVISYNRVKNSNLDNQFNTIASEIGTQLSKRIGFFGEFTIDVGEDDHDQLHIFEVNCKPMQFTERSIERIRFEQLNSLFRTLSK
ncbi:YheC/YheD family protein [Peribacillus alkalitolerans]|uniref:YheC/YheD family endospore coat-associated protein n=1 Tax=Peribacillus alkalitolerans TaxID=1550385 RepID=UPI0013D76614|nr:YheC/YheD family protein [Peribacillus alkalitolerans]